MHQGLAAGPRPADPLKLGLALAPWWLFAAAGAGYALLRRAAGQAEPGRRRLVRRSGLAGSAAGGVSDSSASSWATTARR